ncbi:hypothetical protein [Mycolicibacterium neoaurum]|uniref:hypothetical protein n=1 Tax=Mycolicibacterium neoaurum TaxID=1795 RepID=UPI001F4CA773|nr:hypothetical protein [Mycolicibacterium neoaurum]
MSKTMTLDESLNELWNGAIDFSDYKEKVELLTEAKQAILQWVADTYDIPIEEVKRKASNG